VRTRVRNGEVTERGLALRAGISQPYLHNVLKGARQMTPDLADRLLRELNLKVADLLPHDDPGQDRARASR
jgi:transcriptional regulator with XRE-family HTH domain